MAKVTKKDQEVTLAAVRKQFAPWIDDETGLAPKLMDFDGTPAVVWEDGAPYDWTILANFGGIEEEFGFSVPAIGTLPKNIEVEPINGYALAIYKSTL